MKDRLKNYTCKICKEKFEMMVFKYSVRSMTGLKGVCESIDCSTKAGMMFIAKKNLKEKKAWNSRKKDMKQKAKTIAAWKDDLQAVVNWIVKQMDKDLKCISHPEMKNFLRWDAGHYYTVKAHSDIRFNFHNIHKQNSQANELHGGCPEYTLGLKQRYSNEYADMVLGLPLKWKGIGKEKYTIPNIRDIYLPNARDLKRRIEKGFMPSRDEANLIIDIYVP